MSILDDVLGPSLAERAFTEGERKGAASSGAALPDGSFPIKTQKDLKNAKRAVGRAAPGKRAKVRAHIAKREKALKEAEAEFAARVLRITEAGLTLLAESAETAALSVTHAPIGKGGTNWITKSKPGNTGQLPAYIQNVRNAIMRDGTAESKATAIAIGRVRTWAEGGGGVGPEVKAAAAKAVAEFDRMRGKAGRSSASTKKLAEYASLFATKPADADGDEGNENYDNDDEPDDPDDLDWDGFLASVRAAPKWVEPVYPRAGVVPSDVLWPGGEDDVTESVRAADRDRRLAEAGLTVAFNPGQHPRVPSGTGGGTFVQSGQSGLEVQGVQARTGAKTDGVFGAKTKQAVMSFQRKNGLQVDGVVGRQTFAALAGHKNAANVKTGALSQQQHTQLAGLAKHGGTLLGSRRRSVAAPAATTPKPPKTSGRIVTPSPLHASLEEAMLVEAERATLDEFPGRVKGLKQGETARMPDGVAVRREATQDGRDVFKVGSPSAYADRPGDVRYFGDQEHRTPEDAIQRAHEVSAARTDPESVGGKTPLRRFGRVDHQGAPVTVTGVDATHATVRAAGNLSAREKRVPHAELKPVREAQAGGPEPGIPFSPS